VHELEKTQQRDTYSGSRTPKNVENWDPSNFEEKSTNMIEHPLSSSTMINHDVASYFLPQRKHGKKEGKDM